MRVRSGQVVASVPLERIGTDFSRAELRFEGLRPPVRTFEVRAFIDEPAASAATPVEENAHYLGSQWFYGLGVPDEITETPDPYDLGRLSQSARTQVPLNVTARLKRYLAGATPHVAPVTLVAVDREGREIADPDLDLEGVSLVTT